MRLLTIIAIALILSSCGYNIKTDKELSRYKYEVEEIKVQMDKFKSDGKKSLVSINEMRERFSLNEKL